MNRAIVKAVLILVVVVAAGVMLGMLASRNSTAPPSPVAPVEPGSQHTQIKDPTNQPLRLPTPLPAVIRPKATNATPVELASANATTNVEPSVTATNLITDWEDRLDNILAGEEEDKVKSEKLLEIFPRLPAEGKEEIMRHLSNLVEDADYAPLGRYLVDATQPESVLDVLIQDVLNRPNSTKLPLLLEVAQQTDHAKAAEAKDLLELFLEEDNGTDWAKWKSKMDTWLKENPD